MALRRDVNADGTFRCGGDAVVVCRNQKYVGKQR